MFSGPEAPDIPAGPGLTRLTGLWSGVLAAAWTWFWLRLPGAGQAAVSLETTSNQQTDVKPTDPFVSMLTDASLKQEVLASFPTAKVLGLYR